MTWRRLSVVTVIFVYALACAPEASAQLDQWGFWENGVTEHWWLSSKDFEAVDATTAVARWDQIGAIKDDATWAGDYFRGSDTHGTYMRWSPSAGFVIASVNKCEARVMGLVYGRVEATPTLVQFFPELDKRSAGAHGGHDGETQHAAAPRAVIRFVPVEWRGERLLIAESEMEDFGDYVAGLGSYNGIASADAFGSNVFFSRSTGGDGHAEAAGDDPDAPDDAAPVVPPGYERLLKRPIEAAVASVGRRVVRREYTVESMNGPETYAHVSLTYVTLDAGTEQGVKDRMTFFVEEPDEGDTVVVLRAGQRSSTAVVVRSLDEHGRETYYDNDESPEAKHTKVAAGWRLTTSPH